VLAAAVGGESSGTEPASTHGVMSGHLDLPGAVALPTALDLGHVRHPRRAPDDGTSYTGGIVTERVLPHVVDGPVSLRRVGRSGFPTHELVGARGTVARLGRDGTLRTFFGRGRRVQLVDGPEWRIKATTSGPYIVPIITGPNGVVATSGPQAGRRCYGINGKHFGYVVVPLGRVGMLGEMSWVMRRHEVEVATMDTDRVIHTDEPLPIAAALMAFTLVAHGIPGEAKLMPSRQ